MRLTFLMLLLVAPPLAIVPAADAEGSGCIPYDIDQGPIHLHGVTCGPDVVEPGEIEFCRFYLQPFPHWSCS